LVEPGQTVAASLQSPVLFTLARDLTQLELRVDIGEADVGRVQRGQAASFVVDAWPTLTFASRVVNVHNLPTAGQTVVTYQGVLEVDNKDMKLRPGMTATATIVSSERKDVLLVPNAALRFTPPVAATPSARGPQLPLFPMNMRMRANRGRAPDKEGNRAEETVWVLRGVEPVSSKILVGGTDGRFTEVTGGSIQPGTPVIVDVEQTKQP
jgi:HlyD family secretion protein